jgi:TrmH family RNA methyltransferase
MISSTSNERVKRIISLQTRRHARRKANELVIEGTRLVREALLARMPVSEVFYTTEYAADADGQQLLDGLSGLGAMLSGVSSPVMQAMSDTQTPQGILAALPVPALEPPDNPDFALVVDAVADPGNLGTIMRTAAAAGVPLMIITSGTVDPTNPKVVRSAMGAHFRLPIRHLSWPGIAGLLSQHVIFMAGIGGGAPHYQVDWTQPCALVVSGEAHGPSDEARRTAHAYVTIPMPGGMESLNVAMAAGILLFEMVRQRNILHG